MQTELGPRRLKSLLEEQSFDVVLLDMNYTSGATSGLEGINMLETIRRVSPETKVILMAAYAGVELAIKVIKAGATDFVNKPWDNSKLLATVLAALRHNQSYRQVRQLQSRQRWLTQLIGGEAEDIIGQSAAAAG